MQEYPLLLLGIIFLAVSSAAMSLAPYLFGRVINYSIPGTNWYSTVGHLAQILYQPKPTLTFYDDIVYSQHNQVWF